MQTIDVVDLVTVTGGTAQPAPPAAAPQGAAPAGGNFLSGLQQFFGFLQSPGFQQLIGSLQGLFGQLAGGSPQTAAPQAGAPQAGAPQAAPQP
jgi:hypothetical protein